MGPSSREHQPHSPLFEHAIVLAGGRSSRFGSDKASAGVNGTTLLEFCVSQMLGVFQRVTVVAKAESSLLLPQDNRVRLVHDHCPDHCALAGICEGLRTSQSELSYITGCDMPFAVPRLIESLHSLAAGRDCALREGPDGRIQPLGGFCRRTALPVIEQMVRERRYRLAEAISSLDAAVLPYPDVLELDPQGLSFVNINTPADLALLG